MSKLSYKWAALKGRSWRVPGFSRTGWILTGIGALLITIVTVNAVSPKTPEVQESTLPTVSTLAVADYRSDTGLVEASAEVRSESEVTLVSEVGVPVQAVYVTIGQTVVAGQPIVEFVHADVDAQLAQANASVAQAQAALDVQLAGARGQDLTRAELAVAQAEQALYQAIAGRDQTRVANEAAYTDLSESIQNTYATTLRAVATNYTTAVDGLLVVADYQQDYFNCSSQTVCNQIETAKHRAMRALFDVNDGGKWNAQTILQTDSGLLPRIEALQSAAVIDTVELHAVLDQVQAGLDATRDALMLTREGLNTPAASGSTATDVTVVEAERATVDAAITALLGQEQALDAIEGEGLVGGEARALYEERVRAEAAMRAANASVETAELNVASAEAALSILVEGPRDVDLASLYAGLQAAEAARAQIAAQYRRYVVTAPIGGVVAQLPARIGQPVGAGQTVASIVNPDALELVAYVSADDRALIETGAVVDVDNGLSGVVTYAAPSIDRATGKVELRISVLDNTNRLIVGEFVSVSIGTTPLATTDTTFLIPLPAIRLSSTGAYVLMVNEEQVIEQRAVETGEVFGERVEVTSGLSINDRILSNVRGLRAGDEVDVQ